MKKALALLIPLIFSGCAHADDFRIGDLSGGMYSNASPNKIPDNSAAYIQNLYTDIEAITVERNGYIKADSTVLGGSKPVSGLWSFTDDDGDEWSIRFSSKTFYKNKPGETPTVFGATVSVTQVPDAAVNLGKIWFVNGTDPMWWFDGTSTGTVSSAPRGKLITPWRNRLVIGNITGARSTLRFSEDGDGTNWTIGGDPTDPFTREIGGANDGQYVRCLETYQDSLIAGRKTDLYVGDGFDGEDLEVREVSRQVGCIEPGTMKESDGALLWLSNRGVEKMLGRTITLISEPIRDITDTLVKNSASQRFLLQTTQADFAAGTVAGGVSTSISAGDVTALTTSYNLTVSSDWQSFTYDYSSLADITTSAGELRLSMPETFNTLRVPDVWTKRGGSGVLVSGGNLNIPYYESSDAGVISTSALPFGTTHQFDIYSVIGASGFNMGGYYESEERALVGISSVSNTSGTTALTSLANSIAIEFYHLQSVTGSNYRLNEVYLNGSAVGIGTKPLTAQTTISEIRLFVYPSSFTVTRAPTVGGTQATIYSGAHTLANVPMYAYMTKRGSSGGPGNSTNFAGYNVYPASFTATRVLDTGITRPIWSITGSTATGTNGRLSYSLAFSSSNDTYSTAVAHTTGTVPSTSERYIKAMLTLGTTSQGTPNIAVDNFTLSAGSTGTFTSSLVLAGPSVSSWGPLTIGDVVSGGAITYEIGSTASASTSSIVNWTAISNGQTPSISTNTYAALRATFTADAGTDTAKLAEFTLAWNEGSIAPAPVATVYDRRYWLSFTTSSASSPYLDTVAVFQRNQSWTLFKGINAASFAFWQDALYFGNSDSTGYAYKFDVGSTDDSQPITSVLITKSYDMGVPHRDKAFRNLYASYKGDSTYTGSFSVEANVDQGSYASLGSADLNEGTGLVRVKFPMMFASGIPQYGRELQFKLSKGGLGDKLKLYDLVFEFEPKEAR